MPKPKYNLIEPLVLKELAKVLTDGERKHPDNEWKTVSDEDHYSALMRHLEDWRMGKTVDDDSNLLALSHVLGRVHFLLYKNLEK